MRAYNAEGKPALLYIKKQDLQKDAYYVGICRNAHIARWDGEQFWHWRIKFGNRFRESIKHPDDEQHFDVFQPLFQCRSDEVAEIPFTAKEVG